MEVGEQLTGVSSPYPVGPGVILTVPLKPFYSCDARVSHELLHSIRKVSSQRIRSLPGAYLSCVGIYKMLNEYPLISKGTHSHSRPHYTKVQRSSQGLYGRKMRGSAELLNAPQR